MGFKQSFICPICNYEAFTSAGSDRGFRIWTNTYICLDCKTINDLVIEKGGFKLISQDGPTPDTIREDQECDDCAGNNFELWDERKRPCPKCGSEMKPDPNGMRMNWD